MHLAHPQLLPGAVPTEAHLDPPGDVERELGLGASVGLGLDRDPPGNDSPRPALQHDGRLGEADADAHVVLGLLGQPLQHWQAGSGRGIVDRRGSEAGEVFVSCRSVRWFGGRST